MPRLHALTGLRFVAAAWVVVFHYGRQSLPEAPAWLQTLASSGYAAVDLFFVLSGFVLTYAHDGRTVPVGSFWAARLARLAPAYLVALLLALPFNAHTPPRDLAVLTMTQSWWPVPGLWRAWNYPAWSVSVETFFYACFPVLLPAVARLDRRALIRLGAGLLVASLVAGLAWGAAPYGSLASDVLGHHPVLRLPEFVLGMALGRWFLTTKTRGHGGLCAVLGAVTAVAAMVTFEPVLPLSAAALALPPILLLVYGLAAGGGPLAWVLSRRPLVALGDASYALYLLQVPIWQLLAVFDWASADDGRAFWGYAVVLVATALLVHHGVERRCRTAFFRTLAGIGEVSMLGRRRALVAH